MALTDEQIDGIAAHLRCNSLEVTGLHSINGPTRTILSPAGVRELARAVESAVLAGMEKDAQRYRWLRERMVGATFDWDGEGMTVLAFEWPKHIALGADCDTNVDLAMSAIRSKQ